jgi:hypothetical protein
VPAGDQRQQGPESHGRNDEKNRAKQDAPKDRLVPDIATAGAQCRDEPLAGLRIGLWTPPGQQRDREDDD